jgi:hypothetical protein
MITRRQWLFQNPPPQTAERFSYDLKDAKDELRAAMAETGAVVLEMFAAQSVKPQKKVSFFKWREERKKLLEAAKSVAQSIVKHHRGDDLGEFEKQGDALIQRLEEFQIQSSRELVNALSETRLWRQKIAQLKEKVAAAAKCPLDGAELMRTLNRKEDLFVCTSPITEDRVQHYFLWTLIAAPGGGGWQPGFREIDLVKDKLPDIDGPMEIPAEAA